jgi:two-component system nitrogen regulation response regulator NtrX
MRRADAAAETARPAVPLLLVGNSAGARRLADDIRAAADASCVLLESEAGLDTIEVAREMHVQSRRTGAFLSVDCAAAEPVVIERELFGEQPRRAPGDLEAVSPRSALAAARGGTLYLGDFAELSAAAQARLARVVRDGEVRVGEEPARLDVCFVATTSSDLDSDVTDGRVRRDLARHVCRTRVVIPGLRRRAEDIPQMIDVLIAEYCEGGVTTRKSLTQAATTLLAAMPWRGNLVELRHAVARLVASATGDQIQLEDVLAHVRFDGALSLQAGASTLRSARQQFERDYIALVLQHHRGRVGDAARALGIQRTNLYRKARQLGIRLRQGFGDTSPESEGRSRASVARTVHNS